MKISENERYSNQYYTGVGLTLNQEVYPGYSFQYWLVNGERVYDYSLTITEEMLKDGKIDIKGVAAIVLEPRASVMIYGSKNYHSIGDYICNFSLSEDEILYLSDGKNCLYSHYIPKLSDLETYGRYKNSNDWRFMVNEKEEY